MPKFPPPPRSPQNRSGFSVALARSCRPSAVTTLADKRLSIVMPYFRVNQPNPPPSVRPVIPVVELMPTGSARACCCVAASTSPNVQPGSTVARWVSGSMVTCFKSERSITMPSSHMALPAMLCPPPRTETSRPLSRAKLTASTTSSVEVQRAMMPGLRSIIAFQIWRTSS